MLSVIKLNNPFVIAVIPLTAPVSCSHYIQIRKQSRPATSADDTGWSSVSNMGRDHSHINTLQQLRQQFIKYCPHQHLLDFTPSIMYWWQEGADRSLININFRQCGSLVVSKSYSLEVTISRIKIIWGNDAFLSSVWDQLNKSIISDPAEHYQLGPQFYRLIFLTICTSALWICDQQPTISWLWKHEKNAHVWKNGQ